MNPEQSATRRPAAPERAIAVFAGDPSARPVPWLRAGTEMPEVPVTAAEALQRSGLDWQVSLQPAGYRGADGSWHVIPGRFATVRSDDGSPFDVVGSRYEPFQNHEAFAFGDHLVDSGEARWTSAGYVRNGAEVFMTMRFPEGVMVGGVDPHDLYLLLRTAHDGRKSTSAMVILLRMRCVNQLNFATRTARHRWSVPHTPSARARLLEARESLQLTFDYADQFRSTAERMLDTSMQEFELRNVLARVLPEGDPRHVASGRSTAKERATDEVVRLFHESSTLADVRGTAWAGFNAVSEYLEWVRQPRSVESQLRGTWVGAGARARDRFVELVGAAA